MFKQFTLVLALAAVAGLAQAQEWGDLEGTFVHKATAPTLKKIEATKDPEFCGKHNLVDEQIVVNKANGGLSGVIVYLFDQTKPKIHPDYEKTAKEPVVIDNENCRFAPHVLAMRTTQTLLVGNKDPLGHNTKADFFNNSAKSFNITIPQGGKLERTFDVAEAAPAKLECSIHPWMNAYVLIREDPYAAVSDKDGKILIKNLPVGDHTFVVWHQNGYLSNVTVDGKPTMWMRGRAKITIKAGKNSLGKVEAAPVVR